MGKALKIIGRILIFVGGLGFIFLGKYVFFLNNNVCISLNILGVYLILRGVIECKIDEINTTEYIYGPGDLSPYEEKKYWQTVDGNVRIAAR